MAIFEYQLQIEPATALRDAKYETKNKLDWLGPQTYLAPDYASLEQALAEIRNRVTAVTNTEIRIVSITPVPKKYNGVGSLELHLDHTTVVETRAGQTTTQDHLTGTSKTTTPASFSLNLEETSYLLFIEIEPKEAT